MAIYYIQYQARPEAHSEAFGETEGAYINCWIRTDSPEDAHRIATSEIVRNGWKIEGIENPPEVQTEPSASGAEYFEQAELDGECYVFHQWPIGAPGGDTPH
jgi:hypothetical protein